MRMPIPDDWDGVSWCCSIIEWPASQQWQAILLGFVTTPTRGPFWDERTGDLLGVLEIGRDIDSRNTGENCTMGCIDDLVEVLNQMTVNITNTIANTGNCGCEGTSGAGIYEDEPEDFENDGTAFPDGYEDHEDYNLSRCKLANMILSTWADDLTRIRSINAAGKSAQAVGILVGLSVLTPIPFVGVVGLAAAILALTAIAISVFVDAVAELRTWVEGLDICLLYSAETAEAAKSAILGDLEGQTFTQDALTKELGSYLINFDALNPLFAPKPTNINFDTIDLDQPCDDCEPCAAYEWQWYVGSGDLTPGPERTVSSGVESPSGSIQLTFFATDTPGTPNAPIECCRNVTVVSRTGTVANPQYKVFHPSGDFFSNDYGVTYCCRGIQMFEEDTPFTAQVIIEETC